MIGWIKIEPPIRLLQTSEGDMPNHNLVGSALNFIYSIEFRLKGCGTVDRAVATYTRDPLFQSNHYQFLVFCQL